jgi:hypothetical protein
MKTRLCLVILVLLASLLPACGRDGQSGSDAPAQTYSATLVELEIVRSADGEPMPVDGLPAAGAEATVR